MSIKIISFEGIDASGKSTLMNSVYDDLIGKGVNVKKIRGPGEHSIGQSIRSIINYHGETITPWTKASLMFSDRRVSLELAGQEFKEEGIENGIILYDRFNASTYAYQMAEGTLSKSEIDNLNSVIMQGIESDLVIYVNTDYNIARKRKVSRNISNDYFDDKKEDFFSKVKENYEKVLYNGLNKYSVVTINGNEDKDKVLEVTMNNITSFLNKYYFR